MTSCWFITHYWVITSCWFIIHYWVINYLWVITHCCFPGVEEITWGAEGCVLISCYSCCCCFHISSSPKIYSPYVVTGQTKKTPEWKNTSGKNSKIEDYKYKAVRRASQPKQTVHLKPVKKMRRAQSVQREKM